MYTLEKEIATHSSILAWRIPWTEKPGGLPSMGSHWVQHNWSDLAAAATATAFKLLFWEMSTWGQCFLLPNWRLTRKALMQVLVWGCKLEWNIPEYTAKFLTSFPLFLIKKLTFISYYSNIDRQGSVFCGCMLLVTQSCLTLCDPMDCSPAGLLCPGDFPGKNAGVGCIVIYIYLCLFI